MAWSCFVATRIGEKGTHVDIGKEVNPSASGVQICKARHERAAPWACYLAELRPFWVVDDLADCSNQSTADRAYHSKSGSSSSAEQKNAAAAVAGALEFGAGVSTKSPLRYIVAVVLAVAVVLILSQPTVG